MITKKDWEQDGKTFSKFVTSKVMQGGKYPFEVDAGIYDYFMEALPPCQFGKPLQHVQDVVQLWGFEKCDQFLLAGEVSDIKNGRYTRAFFFKVGEKFYYGGDTPMFLTDSQARLKFCRLYNEKGHIIFAGTHKECHEFKTNGRQVIESMIIDTEKGGERLIFACDEYEKYAWDGKDGKTEFYTKHITKTKLSGGNVITWREELVGAGGIQIYVKDGQSYPQEQREEFRREINAERDVARFSFLQLKSKDW